MSDAQCRMHNEELSQSENRINLPLILQSARFILHEKSLPSRKGFFHYVWH